MAKKKRKPGKQPAAYVPARGVMSKSAVRRTRMVNPIIAAAVAITMILALVVTVLPGVTSGTMGDASKTVGGRQVVDNSRQQRISALETTLKNSPNDIGTLTQLGNEYFDTGQYDKAIEKYALVLEQTPANADVRTDMGIAYYYLGIVDKAIGEYKKALEVDPKKRQTLYNLGIAYADSTPPDVESALAQWQQVVDLYPGSEDAKKAQEKIASYKK